MNRAPLPKVELATADYSPQLDVMCHHFPSGHVVYLFHALGKGYFKEENLLPVFARTNHSPKVVQALEAGINPVGTATATSVILAAAAYAGKGGDPAEYPVKMVYQADQNYSSAFYSLSNEYRKKLGLPLYEKDITSPRDLIGKIVRVGGGGPTFMFEIMVKRHGLQDRVNRNMEANGYQADMINLTWVEEFDVKTYSNLMLQGKLDVYSKPTFGHGQFLGRAQTSEQGLEYSSFSTLQAGVETIYGVGIVATLDFINEHADMLKSFLRAVDRAMPECIDDHMTGVKAMNQLRGYGEQYDVIEGIKAAITVGRHPEITGPGGFYSNSDTDQFGHGYINRNKLQRLIDTLTETGLLDYPIKPEDVFTRIDFRAPERRAPGQASKIAELSVS
jgi:ABC-type nitrate/sulfonate/bicarbonate transport system substrate-binding protein